MTLNNDDEIEFEVSADSEEGLEEAVSEQIDELVDDDSLDVALKAFDELP